MPRFVLEIGTEEIPPRFFPPALAQLRQDGEARFGRARLSFTELKVYGTPRRLVLIAENLAERQAPHQREERGPAAKVAFDKDGNPTKAAQGFASRYRLKPEDFVVRKTEQGEYVYAIIQEPELPAKEALPSLLPDLITGLSFPKTMRWGTGKLRFGRPIRWLLALLDSEVVEFELDGIKSGRLTRGHPTLAEGMYGLPDASEYEDALRKLQVIVDPKARESEARRQIERVEAREKAHALGIVHPEGFFPTTDVISVVPDKFARDLAESLLWQTVFLVESPTAAVGSFDPAFLDLPRPVLIDEMQHVQSYFPLEDERGNLLPRFIAVRDGGEDHLDSIIRGWERVLRAKLIDADFFYHQDLKTPLAERVEALEGVVFQERLGSMYDKVERVRAAAAAAAKQIGLSPDQTAHLERAALLCKADLTTEVVTELPNLQGVMGREYALASCETQDVADAIGEHYRPRFAGDAIPETKLGRLLALADKVDTLTSLFAIGVTPTGSADPFGLRREAAGVVAILVTAGSEVDRASRFELSVTQIARACLTAHGEQVNIERRDADVITEVLDFLGQRLEAYLRDDEGVRYDLVAAALAAGVDDISSAYRRASTLKFAREWDDTPGHPPFMPTVIACTRPMNIARGFEGGDVDPALFVEPAERELWAAYREVASTADKGGPLIALLKEIAERLREPIDRYFDDVLVMHEDEALRRNRLAMCWQLSQLFRRIADFTLIVQV